MDSILTSIKKMLGPEEDYEHFDQDIIIHINSVFFILYQLGIGSKPFRIEDKEAIWYDFMPEGEMLELVKSYMYLRVRMLFDPPQSSALMEVMNNQIKEFESRLNIEVD